MNNGDGKDQFNLEATKFDGVINESKLLWAFGNYASFVRPSMVRVQVKLGKGSTEEAKELMASAFYNQQNQELSLILINETEDVKSIDFTNQNIQLSKT